MGQRFALQGRSFEVAPRFRAGGGYDLVIDGEPLHATLVALGDGRYELHTGGRNRPLWLAIHGDRAFVHADGRSFEVTRIDELKQLQEASLAMRGGAGLTAPMPGLLVEVRAPVDSIVEAGDTIVVIESMKLQTAITAPVAGRVSEIGFSVGQNFDQGAVLARVEASTEGGDTGNDSDATNTTNTNNTNNTNNTDAKDSDQGANQ